MSSFVSGERRKGISWKAQTLDSLSPPPLPLMVFSGLLIMLLYFAICSDYNERIERKRSGFRFGLLLLPMAVVVAMNVAALRRRVVRHSLGASPVVYEAVAAEEEGGSAVGLVVVLVMLLVMVHYQSSVKSGWFRLF